MPDRICLVTTSQPAANPRLVKEADALTAAGFDVRVIGAYWNDWATAFDADLLGSRSWRATVYDWRRSSHPVRFWKTRVRHWIARRAVTSVPGLEAWCGASAASRIGPEIRRLALATPADLYVAHNLGALPAALAAGRRFGAPVGFDAEDFHSGQVPQAGQPAWLEFTRRFEARHLPRCGYVTAASPLIAEAYAPLLQTAPVCVLNVFPLSHRPAGPPAPPAAGRPLSLYWYSQTIGPNRGLEDVVQAVAGLSRGAAVLHVRGQWWRGYEQDLRRLASQSGLPPEAIVSHPPAPPENLVRLASTHDVGLALEPRQPQNSDLLLSNKLFAYLLGGLAVVATSTRAQRQLLETVPDAADLYSPGDVPALTRLLGRLAADPDALRHRRLAAWACGERRFNWDIEQHAMLAVVRDAVRVHGADRVARPGAAERPARAGAARRA
jgi:hypothetical protein